MANNWRDFDILLEKLRTEHFELLRNKLSRKESVISSLYDLIEYMGDNLDPEDLAWVKTVADVIEFIKTNCEG